MWLFLPAYSPPAGFLLSAPCRFLSFVIDYRESRWEFFFWVWGTLTDHSLTHAILFWGMITLSLCISSVDGIHENIDGSVLFVQIINEYLWSLPRRVLLHRQGFPGFTRVGGRPSEIPFKKSKSRIEHSTVSRKCIGSAQKPKAISYLAVSRPGLGTVQYRGLKHLEAESAFWLGHPNYGVLTFQRNHAVRLSSFVNEILPIKDQLVNANDPVNLFVRLNGLFGLPQEGARRL
jgi:hypothetical protein